MLSGRGMLSSAAAKEVTDGSDRARSPAAPKAGPKAGPEPEPATDSCGAHASDDGESGQPEQADRSTTAGSNGLTLPTFGLPRAYLQMFCVRRRSQHLRSIGSRSEEMVRASSPRRWKQHR